MAGQARGVKSAKSIGGPGPPRLENAIGSTILQHNHRSFTQHSITQP